MGSIFDVIKNDLQTIRLQTELLEACEWDESLVEEFSSCLLCAMHYAEAEAPKDYSQMLSLIEEVLRLNGYDDIHVSITKRMIEHHEKEIKQTLELIEQ